MTANVEIAGVTHRFGLDATVGPADWRRVRDHVRGVIAAIAPVDVVQTERRAHTRVRAPSLQSPLLLESRPWAAYLALASELDSQSRPS